MKNDIAIKVENVSKKYCKTLKRSMLYGISDISRNLIGLGSRPGMLRRDEFWGVDDISFELEKGQVLGLIGPNGAGKTTVLKLMNGIFWPDKGRITLKGRIGALIEVGAGFHPMLTGRENIYLNASILGMTKKETDRKFDEIVEFSGIADFLDTPVKFYSSGMFVRLGFSVAVHSEPDILLVDEVLAVGDSAFRAKCYKRIGEILPGSAVVLVSHNMVNISRLCENTIVLEGGRAVFHGETDLAIDRYHSLLKTAGEEPRGIFTCPSMNSFSCRVLNRDVNYGDNLKIELSFDSSEDIRTGLCLMAVSEADVYVGQTDFSEAFKEIKRGKNRFILEAGPACLRKGEYEVTITVLDVSKKQTIVHAVNCDEFVLRGPRGYGVEYQIPYIKIY